MSITGIFVCSTRDKCKLIFSRGVTTSLKLSPNLRVMVKPPKKQLYLDQLTLQNAKLEKLLSLVRELPEGSPVPDAATTVRT